MGQLVTVVQQDCRPFFRAQQGEELGHRAALGYPPFGRLVHTLVSGPDAEVTLAAATRLAQAAGPEPGVDVLGPAPAPLARLRGRHRFQILAKGADAQAVRRVAERLRAAADRLPEGVQAAVDPRPINML